MVTQPSTETIFKPATESKMSIADITGHKNDKREGKLRKQKSADAAKKQGKVLTGVKFSGAAGSKVIVGERKIRTTAGVKFDPVTHKRITHVFKEPAPLDSKWADMSLDNLKDEMKTVVSEIKDLKTAGKTDEVAAKKAQLKEMKRAQDDIKARTECGADNPFLGNDIAAPR
jgi:hypothetical protein